MTRGRKLRSFTGLDSGQIFDRSQGTYLRYIAMRLGEKNKRLTDEEASALLATIRKSRAKTIHKKRSKNGDLSECREGQIPFRCPPNWVWTRFNEIGVFTGGGTPSMSNPLYWNGDIPWISPKDMRADYVADSEMKITSLGVANSAAKIIPPNSLLIVGRSGILKRKLPVAINQNECTVNQDMKVVIPYLPEMSRYLQLMLFGLQDFILQDYVKFGMTVHSLQYKEFEEMPIPLPPLSDQKRILEFLQDFGQNEIDVNREYFDSEIESEVVSIHQAQVYGHQLSTELDHQLALVKELRQAYLREAMQGKLVPQDPTDEPAEILLEKIKAEKEKLVAEKRIKRDKPLPPINPEELPFEIPLSWNWCRLGDISIQVTDGEHQTPPRISEGRMLLSAKNIRDGFIDYDNVDFISEEHYQKSIKRCKPEKGDVLIVSVGATIGRSTILDADREFAIVRSVALIKPFISQLSQFFKFVLDSPILQREISGRKWGTAQPCLYLNQIKELTIPLPPLAEQERIVAKLEKLMKFCDELEANIKEGITNADRLLQTALREALEPKERY